MQRSTQRDFTQGSIPRHLLLFSLPLFAGNLLQVLYNTVDSIWVGRFVGVEALGAVSVSFPLMFALLSMIFGITMATTTLVAQYRGAKNEDRVRQTVTNSMTLMSLGALVMSVLGVLFRYQLLDLIRTPVEMRQMAADYLGIFMAGLLPLFVYNALGAILRGLGDSKTPLTFMVWATLANIILDPLLIIGVGPFPQMGVAGAALATVLSQSVACLFMFRWVMKQTDLIPRERHYWRLDLGLIKLILKIGLPAGVQQTLVAFGMVAVVSVVNGFGKTVVAAFGAASRLDQLAFLPAMSIGLAVTSMVGQNLGARQFDRVSSIVRWAALIGITTGTLVGLLAIFNPTVLMVLFTTDQQVLTEGSAYLQVMGFVYVGYSLLFILGGVMRGAGDTIPVMIFTVVALWLFRVPLAFLLSQYMGSRGIWLGIGISAYLGLLLHLIYYLSGRWKRRVATHQDAHSASPPPLPVAESD